MGHFGPYPYQPFPKAVSPVPAGETQEICFRFDEKWLPYMLAALKTLAVPRTWESDQVRATGEANNLLTALMLAKSDCMPTITDGQDCVEFGPNAPFIEYFPINPYFQAGAIPENYLRTPWIVLPPGFPQLPLLHAQAGDVFTGFFGQVISPDLGNEAFPRIRVHVSGSGVVELHLLKLPYGGGVVITTDDNLATSVFVELEASIIAIPPELVITEIIEVTTTGGGAHHIDILYVPRLSTEPPFVSGSGGGLRKVVLCGFDEIAPVAPTWWQRGDELEDCMRLRISPDDPCIIQNECSPGEWENWYDPRECIAEIARGATTQPGAGGEIDPAGHYSQCPTLAGNGLYKFPKKVSPGDIVTVTDAAGGWCERNTFPNTWNCPSGQVFQLGICGAMSPNGGAGYPMPAQPKMRLIASYDGVYYDAFNTAFTIPESAGQSELVFSANDNDITDNTGSITFCVDVLHPASGAEDFSAFDWMITIDMEHIDYSWLMHIGTANGNAPNGYVVGTGVQSGPSGNYIAADFRLHIAGGYSEVRAVAAEIYSAKDGIPATPEGFHVHTSDNIGARGYYQPKTFEAGVWTALRVDIPAGEAQVNPGYDTWVDFEAVGGIGGAANDPNVIIRKLFLAGSGTTPGLIIS